MSFPNTDSKCELLSEMAESELATVVGGSTMDIISQAWTNSLKECLYRLNRDGTTTAYCPPLK